ncbi:MAG TPA: DUF969 domain-containing protein [Rheinheimera sp.]|nr:DUF969 domain-containing protein [Rheinheimera sp.]
MNYWPFLGIAVVVIGFVLRFNPVIVVFAALITTGLSALLSPIELLAAIGTAFLKTRSLPLILFLPLAIIGLLERHGLKQQAQQLITRIKSATVGRLLITYLAVRELSAALGLTSLGGHPQMVRPLIAPMAEALAEQQTKLTEAQRERVKALAAATDNVGLFFGEDVFVAFGAVVLMHTVLVESGIAVDPLHIALWGLPTAFAAFVLHSVRLYRFDRQLTRSRR